MMISLLRTLIGMGGAVGFAILLYHFSIFELDLPLIAFFFISFSWELSLPEPWFRYTAPTCFAGLEETCSVTAAAAPPTSVDRI